MAPLVDAQAGGELLTTIVGGMRLTDYLPTRTFELVVHTADLATVLGLSREPPVAAATHALEIMTGLALAGGNAGPLLLAATGRPVPTVFSVL